MAYGALAWYDRIALLHLDRKLSLVFVALVSFTTYALSHNVGASAFSGAVVRFRAYSTKGLSLGEIGIMVAFCAFTFMLGAVFMGGLVLVAEPGIIRRLSEPDARLVPFHIHIATARLVGAILLVLVAIYIVGAVLRLKPLVIGSFRLAYPRMGVALRQLAAGPLELVGAAGIIYFALPSVGNPGFFIVLAVFLASFSAALISHAPGGLGVFELVFLKAMPDLAHPKVFAALIVFRVFYLIVPLIFAIGVVIVFERNRLRETLRARRAGASSNATPR